MIKFFFESRRLDVFNLRINIRTTDPLLIEILVHQL